VSEVCARSNDKPDWCDGSSNIGGAQLNVDSQPLINGDASGNWRSIMSEDFKGGMGPFRKGQNFGTKLYVSAKDRRGVVRLQQRSMLYTDQITLNEN
jgi:hypothetical protein